MLTPERLRDLLHYTPETGAFVWRRKPHPKAKDGIVGAVAGGEDRHPHDRMMYWRIRIDRSNYRRGRLAFLYMAGRWPHGEVDHRNGDGLDDRWKNLREATSAQNCWNRHHKPRGALPVGVYARPSGRYTARIMACGRAIVLGTFDTINQAGEAYVRAREKYHGEWGRPRNAVVERRA